MQLTSVICSVLINFLHMDMDMDTDMAVDMLVGNWVDTVDMDNILPEKIKLQKIEIMTI